MKNFPGAKVRCMENYAQTNLRSNPAHILLHIVTNEVSTKKEPIRITYRIIKLQIT